MNAKPEVLSTRQVGQRIRHGSLPPDGAKGHWQCPKHPRRKLGETETWWNKGDTACGGAISTCPPSRIFYPAYNIIVDLSL